MYLKVLWSLTLYLGIEGFVKAETDLSDELHRQSQTRDICATTLYLSSIIKCSIIDYFMRTSFGSNLTSQDASTQWHLHQ